MNQTVYVCQSVADVEALHPYLTGADFRALPIRDQLARQAETLLAAHGAGDRRVAVQTSSWWPPGIGQSPGAILDLAFDQDAARLTVAWEHGFADWPAVEALGAAKLDSGFESAVDALVTGRLADLAVLLEAAPDLVRRRSGYGHRATLLHYLGANGVETHRQKTPLNAVEIARLLIARGADVAAEAEMYGGGQTTRVLVETSAHPAAAGVAEELVAVLMGE
ncbi:MAG: hypothetical protein AAF495_28820 [Pseudomonadota bacterium]